MFCFGKLISGEHVLHKIAACGVYILFKGVVNRIEAITASRRAR